MSNVITFIPKTEAKLLRQCKAKKLRAAMVVEVRRRLAIKSPKLLADALLRTDLEEVNRIVAEAKAKRKTKEFDRKAEKEILDAADAAYKSILERAMGLAEAAAVSSICEVKDTRTPEEIEQAVKLAAVELEARKAGEAKMAQKACKACPGFCCLAFGLAFSKRQIRREKLPAYRRDLAAALARRDHRIHINLFRHGQAVVDGYTENSIQRLTQDISDAVLMLDMLIPIKATRRLQHDRWRGQRTRYFACKHFQIAERRCGIYETRPYMCKGFLCETAHRGTPPPVETMYAHPSNTPLNAEKLMIPWKPLEIPAPPKRVRKRVAPDVCKEDVVVAIASE